MKRNVILLIGFLFFTTGFLSIVFAMIGFKFNFLAFLNDVGPGFAFLVYIILFLLGIAMMYVSKTTISQEEN